MFNDVAMYVTDLRNLYISGTRYANIAPDISVINSSEELKAFFGKKNLAYGDKAELDAFVEDYVFDGTSLVVIKLVEPTHNITHSVSSVSYYSDVFGISLDIIVDTTGGTEPPKNTTCFLIVELNSEYTELATDISVKFTGVRRELSK
jgi:hypothetical protein